MLRNIPPQMALMSAGIVAALATLSGFYSVPEFVQQEVRAHSEPRADGMVRAFMTPGDAVSPVVKEDTQWYGLCSAYAASTVSGFKAQVMSDPRLMEYYKNFDWEHAQIFENQQDSYSSVLYKKNEKVYWTRKPLLIQKGEKILTDGKVLVRTYCCNQIALMPPGPFLPPAVEPPAEAIQPPEAPAIPEFPLAPPTLDLPPAQLTFIPPPPPLSFKQRSSRRPIPVPEPATFILFLSGLAALTLRRRPRAAQSERA
jgi:hypothetical protein